MVVGSGGVDAHEIRRVFRAHDQNESGAIDMAELRVALNGLGLPVDTAAAVAALEKYSSSGRVIELHEFQQLVMEVQSAITP